MKNLLFALLSIATLSISGNVNGQYCPNSYTKSPLQAKIFYLGGGEVTDVVAPDGIYYLHIKPIDAVMNAYPNTSAVNIGVQAAAGLSGFQLYHYGDTGATSPYSTSVIQSGVGPDVGTDQTAKFVIKINSSNTDGQISFNGGYYMCVDYYDSNNLPVYKVMPVKLLLAP